MRLLYWLGSGIALAVAAVVLAPIVACAALERLWRVIELQAVYGGNKAARARDDWRA